jgi:hypothetical protein
MQPEIAFCKLVIGQDPKIYADRRRQIAMAENARAVDQGKCFELCPTLFKLNYYLEIFSNDLQGTRKYVIATDQVNREELQFDLQEKQTQDMADINPNAIQFGGGN